MQMNYNYIWWLKLWRGQDEHYATQKQFLDELAGQFL